MQRILLAALALALCVTVPAATAQKPPKEPKRLSISAVPSPVKLGRSVTISGKLTGPNSSGRTIALREDPFPFDDFDQVGTTTADAQGDYSFTRTPAINTRYRASQGGVESEVVTVLVRPRISLRLSDRTPAAGRRVRFYGRVCPEHDGATLAVQRRTAPRRWRTVRRTTLADAPGSSCSRYSRRVRVRRDGVWRTALRAHADHAAGRSRSRRIDVH